MADNENERREWARFGFDNDIPAERLVEIQQHADAFMRPLEEKLLINSDEDLRELQARLDAEFPRRPTTPVRPHNLMQSPYLPLMLVTSLLLWLAIALAIDRLVFG